MESLLLVVLGIAIATVVVMLRRRFAEFPGQNPDDYSDGFPAFDLREHLNGRMLCEGAIFGPLGRVTSTFTATFDVRWEGDTGVMTEVFRYNNGSTQEREWVIHLGENGHFTTVATDVPKGGTGVQTGMAVHMRYAIRLPRENGGHTLNTIDWMYLTPDGTILNRSQFRKYGFKVAELVATIRPREMR
jgi:hypothetical protein